MPSRSVWRDPACWVFAVLLVLVFSLAFTGCGRQALPPSVCSPVRQTNADLQFAARLLCPHLEMARAEGATSAELEELRRVCAQADAPWRDAAVDAVCPVQ